MTVSIEFLKPSLIAILSSLTFHRSFSLITPKDETIKGLDIVYVMLNACLLIKAKLDDYKIDNLISDALAQIRGETRMKLSLSDRQAKAPGWFKGIIYWEEWNISVSIGGNLESTKDSISRALLQIAKEAWENKVCACGV